MLAVRLHAVGDVRLEEVAPPPPPGPGQVVVAPLWCGLCGTDAREYFGPGGSIPDEPHVLTGIHKPAILGHEFSAVVAAIGTGVTRVTVGDTVAVFPLVTCGRCTNCLQGRPILCPFKAWMGMSTAYGGLGDLVLTDEAMVSPLGGIDPVVGAMIEPASVALEAAAAARIRAGDTVLVSGCGPIGVLTVLATKALGASLVFANDPQPQRAAAAEALGAVIVPSDPDDALDVIHQLAPDGVAAAVNCAGKESSLDLCIRAVRPGGTISVPAVHTAPPSVDLWRVTRNALTVVGSLGYSRENWDRTIALVASGAYPIGDLDPILIERERIVEDGLETLGPTAAAATKILVRVTADRA